jgi:hypothetical protein
MWPQRGDEIGTVAHLLQLPRRKESDPLGISPGRWRHGAGRLVKQQSRRGLT